MKRIPLNPEFRRQLWLEFSTVRLIGMPIILGLIFYLTYLGDGPSKIYDVAIYLFYVIVILWGSFRAVNSMTDEVQNSTWDFQKMSPQSAWSLGFGKLFGSTSYVWYGGLLCLAVITVMYFMLDKHITDPFGLAELIYSFVATAIIGHALGIILCLQDISYRLLKGRLSLAGYTLAAIFVASTFWTNIVFSDELLKNRDSITWYGESYDFSLFRFISLTYFALWALTGLNRSMRRELQYRDKPYAWTLFLLTFIVYFAGFINRDFLDLKIEGKLAIWYSVAFFISVAFTYAWAFLEARDKVMYRRLFNALKAKKPGDIFESTPKWVISAIIMILSWVLILSIGSDKNITKFYVFFTGVLLFIIRDIGVLHLLFFSKKNKRAPIAFILYLSVFYILLPMIEKSLAGFDKGWAVFVPVPGDNFLIALFPICLQIVIVGTLLKRLWLSRNKEALSDDTEAEIETVSA